MVDEYDSRCYQTLNTGPDKLTLLWNELCAREDPLLADAELIDGLIKGPITVREHRTPTHASPPIAPLSSLNHP